MTSLNIFRRHSCFVLGGKELSRYNQMIPISESELVLDLQFQRIELLEWERAQLQPSPVMQLGTISLLHRQPAAMMTLLGSTPSGQLRRTWVLPRHCAPHQHCMVLPHLQLQHTQSMGGAVH